MSFYDIITDTRDPNAIGRVLTRLAAAPNIMAKIIAHHLESEPPLWPIFPILITQDLDAGCCLVDQLDASQGTKGVILVNAAPRNGSAKRWPNGSQFASFWYRETLVISTIGGYELSFAKLFNLIDGRIWQLDLQDLLDRRLVKEGVIPSEEAERIKNSQFRSFDILPYIIVWLAAKGYVHGKEIDHGVIPQIDQPRIWYIDQCGNSERTNLKTTIVPALDDIKFPIGGKLETVFGELPCYEGLRDVPDDELAMIIGSSGFGEHRFLEIVVQGGSAYERLTAQGHKIEIGTSVL